ncbi:MAG TPA: serine/threonine-protein kinase [Solirubrobacteraceae bacterium]|jgi:serine/threonine-protein kinase
MHRSGTVLAGRYKVVRHVGSGGMGTVHLAIDETLGREVAVKSVHAEPESELGRRIMREARLGAGLRHPHLVTVYDVLPEGDALLLVTEYVEGETLADALRRGPMDTGRALEVVRGVADALDHAHERGIVHRDVKPANVLLGAGGAVKLADLGIATAADSTKITKTGGALGTVAYMAPEQFEPEPVTAAADVYALASVAFEAISGRRAFEGTSAFARLGKPPPDVRDVRPDLPAAVGDVLRRGMATDPADRPSSAGELAAELERALEPTAPPSTAPPPGASPPPGPSAPRPPRRRRSALVPLALLAILAIAGLLVALAVGGGDDDPESPSRAQTGPTATTSRAQDAPARGPQTPSEAVRQFYTALAEGDFGVAWRLSGPRFRSEYGGSRASFEDDFASLRGIRFEKLEDVGANKVALQTVAEHTDRTERCTGTISTVIRGGTLRVEPFGVSCDPLG